LIPASENFGAGQQMSDYPFASEFALSHPHSHWRTLKPVSMESG